MEVADEVKQAIERAVVAGSYWTDARQFPATASMWETLAKRESEAAKACLSRFATKRTRA